MGFKTNADIISREEKALTFILRYFHSQKSQTVNRYVVDLLEKLSMGHEEQRSDSRTLPVTPKTIKEVFKADLVSPPLPSHSCPV